MLIIDWAVLLDSLGINTCSIFCFIGIATAFTVLLYDLGVKNLKNSVMIYFVKLMTYLELFVHVIMSMVVPAQFHQLNLIVIQVLQLIVIKLLKIIFIFVKILQFIVSFLIQLHCLNVFR